MFEIVEKSKCVGCGACKAICPNNAIIMKSDSVTGFLYPFIDNKFCVNCNLCKKACPILNSYKENTPKETFAAYALDEDIRENSSSGGMFSLLSEKVLSENGIVFGVSMTEDCLTAEHILVDKIEDVKKLRGSKYLQSNTKNSFFEVKQLLADKKVVLFSGTPCQVAGLKTFLGKEYENLITVDFICHGTPSPLAWKKYLEYREQKEESKIQKVYFRNKKYGWKLYSVKLDFSSGIELVQVGTEDLYIKGFVNDLYLRSSCFNCQFKNNNYQSDITLADFWGIEKIKPEWNDNKGISLVITNTEKGKSVLNTIKEKTICEKVNFNDAFIGNPSYFSSVKKRFIEKFVFNDLNKLRFDKFIEKYIGKSISAKCLRKIHKIITRLNIVR